MKKLLILILQLIIVNNIILASGTQMNDEQSESDEYQYMRSITEVKDRWHTFVLPYEIFQNIAHTDLRDIRIYGSTNIEFRNNKEERTIVPYILDLAVEEIVEQETWIVPINQQSTEDGYYYIFSLPNLEDKNSLLFKISDTNYDWLITVSGKKETESWAKIVDNYRLVSIDYQGELISYSNLVLPQKTKNKYDYIRVFFKNKKNAKETINPQLVSILLNTQKIIKGKNIFYNYDTKYKQEKDNQNTVVEINLPHKVPVNNVHIEFNDDYEFIRSAYIEGRKDSITHKDEEIERYNHLSQFIVQSEHANLVDIKSNDFYDKLRLVINNANNNPLEIKSIKIQGIARVLTARFDDPKANYWLLYGNTKAYQPLYDIQKIDLEIPDNIQAVSLGNEEMLATKEIAKKPLLESKLLLWIILGCVVILLALYALHLKKNISTDQEEE